MGTLIPEEVVTLTYTLTLNGVGSFPEGTSGVFNAAAVASSNDTTPDDNAANDTIFVFADGEVNITKSDNVNPAAASPGDPVGYTLTVTATGNADSIGVIVTDDYDESAGTLSAVSNGGNANGGVITWNLGTMSPDDVVSLTYTLTLNAAGFFPEGSTSVSNVANVSSANDGTPGDNIANDTITVEADGEVNISKSDNVNPATASPGDAIGYTLTVTATGNADSTAVTVTDDYDESAGTVSAISGEGTESGGVITWDLGTMSPDDVASLTYTLTLNGVGSFPEGTTSVSKVANVSSANDTTTGDNSDNDTVTVQANGEVNISKSDNVNPGTASPGDPIGYTLTVTATGDAPVTGVIVTDDYDQTAGTVSAISNGGTESGGVINWNLGTMNPDDVVTLTYTLTLNGAGSFPNGTTNVPNTAGVSSPDDTTLDDNTAQDTVVVAANGEISVSKTDNVNPATASPGDAIGYTVTVTATGDAPVTTVTITDDYDESAGSVSAISDGGTALGGVITWTLASIGPVEEVDLTYTLTLNGADSFANGTTDVNNVAVVASLDDSTPDDNSDNDTVVVAANGEISISKADNVNPAAASPGDSVNYTLTVNATGNAPVTAVIVTDDYDQSAGTVSAISDGGTSDGDVITWNLGALGPEEQTTLTYTLTLNGAGSFPEGSTPVNNVAVVGSPDDSKPGDNTANDTVAVEANGEVNIGKAHIGTGPFAPGDAVDYTVTVTATGNAPSTAVTVTDDYDEAAGSVGAISNGGLANGGVITWNLGTLNPGDVADLTYTLTLNGAGAFPEGNTTVANTSVVSSPEDTTDGDNTASDSVVVTADGEVNVTKAHTGVSPFSPGDAVAYTVTVSATGNAPSTSVTVTDDYDETAGTAGAISNAGSALGGVITWDLGTLNPGDVVNLTYTLTLNGAGSFTEGDTDVGNTAVVSSPEDTTEVDNTASDNVVVTSVVELGLAKGIVSIVDILGDITNVSSVSHNGATDAQDSVTAVDVVVASNITYSLIVTNGGDADAANVEIVDTLPAGLAVVNNPDGGLVIGNTITWNLGTVAAQSTATVSVTVQTLHLTP